MMVLSFTFLLAVALVFADSVFSNHIRYGGHDRREAAALKSPWEPHELLSRQSGQTGGTTSASSSNGDYTCGPGRPFWLLRHDVGVLWQRLSTHCKQPKPVVKASKPRKVVIGYYEGWNMGKACGTMSPEDIPIRMLTHVFFSFGFIAPGTFKIENMKDFQPSLFGRVTDLKMKNPDLKVVIALGGWTHNDPGPYQKVFSDMASTAANRKKFIQNILGFMTQYGFDGVDIDWEYPGAEDRGGIPEDGENFTLLLQDLKAAFDGRYILTFTIPTSYWYLRHFDIKKSVKAADWVNLMSYDLHGVWDQDNPIGSHVMGHSNITEIDLALNLLWRNDIPPNKIVLGTGFYGRTFALEDPSCTGPGCKFSGPGSKGPCTDTAGFLSYKGKYLDILRSSKAKAKFDKKAAVKYLTYGQHSWNKKQSASSSSSELSKRDESNFVAMDMSSVTSWISYDDASTIETKVDFASEKGLMGVMSWAVDLDDEQGQLIRGLSGGEMESIEDLAMNVTEFPKSVSHTMQDPSKCYISKCGEFCKSGYTGVSRSNTDLNGRGRCDTGKTAKARFICCPSFSGPKPEDCRWDDSHSSAYKKDCSGKCKVGEILIVNDSFGWKGTLHGGGYGDRCSRGAKSFCCKAGNMEQYLKICTWTKCGGKCPSDRPYELTTDSGGPNPNGRCTDSTNALVDPQGAKNRRLYCPSKNSFRNCGWNSAKYCSSTCGLNQITLDLDPLGKSSANNPCHNGRQQAFCCDPPGGLNSPFLPVDLEKLFPPKYRPSPDAQPTFELASFGRRYTGPTKDENPNNSGVAFFLVAGSYTAVSSMSKRENPGLEFIDCPSDILSRSNDEHQTVRVVCYSENVPDCFRVQEGGVEGTVVQMPEECGGTSWARAISLTLSQNQTVPGHLAKRGSTTSPVFDFKFDYNTALVRRDAGEFSVRMDFSNVPGYWNAVVDAPGSSSGKRDLKQLVDRFYGCSSEWYSKFKSLKFPSAEAIEYTEKLDQLVYHNPQVCQHGGKQVGESLSIAMEGTTTVKSHFGFSMIATWKPGKSFKVHQAAGFFHPDGKTDMSFKIGGQGVLDSSQSLKVSTITKILGESSLAGKSIYKGWASFDLYRESRVNLRSSGGNSGAVAVDGYAESRIQSDWGRVRVDFPAGGTEAPLEGDSEGRRVEDKVSTSKISVFPLEL
ncbi:unnamed protein product [Penicillium salamii]|uniref:chitinase n=1 Tax=Penicillium salamii TaxID=1612424 RepID=A0A9W4JMK0_9EURO|nr:unnamed protein product [Penicillium salamii]CAG8300078.1 unnamed protein product [Penicillium salamii]CAG8353598.1 unnamed protein product [Penicillium salamii]CAG8359655.1 unnamed protein product [Penicillium salamii]CAG8367863.1 unnamed protein product [Penicillium salamii]